MIVVTFALPAESSAFIRLLRNVTRDGAVARGELKHRTSFRAGGSTKPEANVEHRTSNVCVLHTGVGAARCEERLGNFLRNETPEL